MEVFKNLEATTLTLRIEGHLDAQTSPDLQATIGESLDGVEHLVLDLNGVEYVSSAGLRVIIWAQKEMSPRGDMVLRNVCSDVMDVFNMTGFSNILTIE